VAKSLKVQDVTFAGRKLKIYDAFRKQEPSPPSAPNYPSELPSTPVYYYYPGPSMIPMAMYPGYASPQGIPYAMYNQQPMYSYPPITYRPPMMAYEPYPMEYGMPQPMYEMVRINEVVLEIITPKHS
jgi:hypothetical protein